MIQPSTTGSGLMLVADGGGSKTRMGLLTREGAIIGRADGSGTASAREGVLPVDKIIGGVCGRLLAEAGLETRAISGVYFSLGGPNAKEVDAALRRLLPHAAVIVDREANGNWVAACAPLLGVDGVLMAGTGCVAVGIRGGNLVFSGGWGPVYGDDGSGYCIGLSAVRRALQMLDERRQRTSFTDIVRRIGLDTEGVDGFESRMRLKSRLLSLSRDEVASLAPDVFKLSSKGDADAMSIILRAAECLARAAASVACTGNARILGTGGIFESGEDFKDMCNLALCRILPDARLVFRPDFNLLKGACIMALMHAGVSVSGAVLQNLQIGGRAE